MMLYAHVFLLILLVFLWRRQRRKATKKSVKQKDTSINMLYMYYKDTLNHCGLFLLDERDDLMLEWHIFEEFDTGVYSFLYADNLECLYRNGCISKEKMEKSSLLREKTLALPAAEWNIHSIRTSEKWRELMMLSDNIKAIK